MHLCGDDGSIGVGEVEFANIAGAPDDMDHAHFVATDDEVEIEPLVIGAAQASCKFIARPAQIADPGIIFGGRIDLPHDGGGRNLAFSIGDPVIKFIDVSARRTGQD
jgi:hypothetical protein